MKIKKQESFIQKTGESTTSNVTERSSRRKAEKRRLNHWEVPELSRAVSVQLDNESIEEAEIVHRLCFLEV